MANQSIHMSHSNYSGHKNSRTSSKRPFGRLLGLILLAVIVVSVPAYAYFHDGKKSITQATTVKSISEKPSVQPSKSVAAQPIVQTQISSCSSNSQPKLILTSISQRHLWACAGNQVVYQTAVITGDMNITEDATPVGTYSIYAKETNLYLDGSDSRGSWHDYVNYWMPFLDNQYGIFGLHDATWRSPSDFGNISPYSDNASHGCIELPLSAAQWLYNWSPIGTPVTIES